MSTGNKRKTPGNSLAVQWLGLGASTAWAQVRSLVREPRSRKLCSAHTPQKRQNTNDHKPRQLSMSNQFKTKRIRQLKVELK